MITKKILMMAVSTLAISQTPGHAQDAAAGAANDSDQSIEEIVVTAQRREQKLSDVGMSISAVSGDVLATRNVTETGDLAKLVPGLSVSDSGFSTPIYTLRGVGINEPSIGSSSSVAIYVDEVPLAYPVITQGATLDLQRVEVLKGPQGTLYGQNSTGGAINYIANKPTDEFKAGVSGTIGRFTRGNVEGYVSGPLSSTLKARIASRAEFGDGWQTSITRKDSLGKVERYTGRAIVEWEPLETLKVTINLNGWIDKSDTLAAQLVKPTPSVPAKASPITLNAPIPPHSARPTDWDAGTKFDRDDKFWQGSTRLDWEFSDEVALTSITAYTHLDRAQNSDFDGINGGVLSQSQTGKIKSFSQEVRLSADFSGVHWVLGANYSDDTTNERIYQNLPLSSQVIGVSNGGGIRADQKIKNWAIFTSLDLPLTDQLTLTGGIRLSKDIRKFQGCGFVLDAFSAPFYTGFVNGKRAGLALAPLATPLKAGDCYSVYNTTAAAAFDDAGLPAATPGLANRHLTQTNVPWNLNLNFKPTDRSLIYARVSRGFKAGNFASLNSLDLGAYQPIVQEELTAYELGGRLSIGRVAQIEAAGFIYDYLNKQLRARKIDPLLGNINAQDNIPKSRLKGVEASLVLRPVQGLTLDASGTYIDTKVTRYVGVTINSVPNFDFAGTAFNFTPKWSINAGANYTQSLSADLDGFVGVNYAYRSKTSAVFAPVGIPNLSIYDIPSYSLVDAQLGVKNPDGKWKAWIWGKNIFNKYYWTNVIKASDITSKYPGTPATYGVTASYSF